MPTASPAPPTVTVVLPSALRALFPEAPAETTVSAATVSDLLDALDARWPGMRDRVRDSTPAIRRHMKVFVDGERASLDTRLSPGAEVFILTAISGG
ncbi:MAG: MoaD/ThiS family protein [Minwuiales bacterium]|nr:MoaD/ThiS family protein [Minwuiales bacterium]